MTCLNKLCLATFCFYYVCERVYVYFVVLVFECVCVYVQAISNVQTFAFPSGGNPLCGSNGVFLYAVRVWEFEFSRPFCAFSGKSSFF